MSTLAAPRNGAISAVSSGGDISGLSRPDARAAAYDPYKYKYFIAIAVTLAAVLELIDTSNVNVAIPHMTWIFYLNVPIGILADVMVWAYVRDAAHQVRLKTADIVGIVLLTVCIGSFSKLYLFNGILVLCALPLLLFWRTGRTKGFGGDAHYPPTEVNDAAPPLCVDLDGTLIEGDTLRLSVISLLRSKPLTVFGMALALIGGRARFKEFVAVHFVPTASDLRWRAEVVEFVRAQHAAGRQILLVTAAHQRIADMVAAHLQIFAAVLATHGALNLKGLAKVRALRKLGVTTFDFVSDSVADLPALLAARHVWLVAPSPALESADGIRERV
ncbi:MAG: haloacid dehalogenase-like hydrolase, partial [Gemmatimonadaceae bacterium]